MKTLIAVCSYDGDAANGNHDKIRETWGKDVQASGADLKFFIGRRGPEFVPKSDEVLINWEQPRTCEHPWYHSQKDCCADFWQLLTKGMLDYSLFCGYSYTFLCQNDTFLIPQKLMKTEFEKYDFSGHFIESAEPYPWPEPGGGYFLSRKAAEVLINAPPDHWSVGMYAGQALGLLCAWKELRASELPDFWEKCSWHYRAVTGQGYPPNSSWQKNMYEAYKNV